MVLLLDDITAATGKRFFVFIYDNSAFSAAKNVRRDKGKSGNIAFPVRLSNIFFISKKKFFKREVFILKSRPLL